MDLQQAALDVIRVGYPSVTLGGFLFLVIWEGGSAPRPVSRLRHGLRNLGLFLLMVIVADGAVGGSLLGIGRHLLDTGDGLLTRFASPLPALIATGVLATDLAAYAFHRLSHRWRFLWLCHAVHHSDPQLDATTGLRFHPIDMAFYVASVAGTLIVLGIPLWVEGVRALILNPLSMAQHANVPWPRWFDRAFGWLLVTPAMHRIHHESQEHAGVANFGQVFSLWDRIFGTYRAPAPGGSNPIGIAVLANERWQTVGGMLCTPWSARRLPI